MRVLICGSRDWADRAPIFTVLDGLAKRALLDRDDLYVIEGGGTGADAIARAWATGARCEEFPADWARHGKAAGPIRNQQMLVEGRPDVVHAFVTKPLPESRGTADMVRRAVAAGIPTYVTTPGAVAL